MAIAVETVEADSAESGYHVARRLGVEKLLKHRVGSAVAVHETLHAGLPSRALFNAMPHEIPQALLLPVFGISLRTLMRLKAQPHKLLDAEQSGRVWQFAELFAKAEDVFQSRPRAAQWLLDPAMALEHRRPIDLLTTPVGAQLVDDVLDRLRYGVYQ